MKQRLFIICIICSLLFAIVLFLFQSNQSSIQTIKYFPLSETASFESALTKLDMDDNDRIDWSVSSISDQPMYLRHDVSLLYENGLFKGVQSKWRQELKEINFEQSVPLNKPQVLEAISFHHGELHPNPNKINSIQKMTADKMYLQKKNQSYEPLKDDKVIKEIDKKIINNESSKWDELINEQQLNKSTYYMIPLIKLADYEDKALPNMSKAHSNIVVGRLWEGLYKNYVLRLKEKQNQSDSHIMPLIMLSKDSSHLYILFELNGEKEVLFQQIEEEASS